MLAALTVHLVRLVRSHAAFVATLVGVVVPYWTTVNALEHPEENNAERLLGYWSLYGAVTIVDHAAGWIRGKIGMYHIPKMVLLWWLFGRGGALAVHKRLLQPLMKRLREELAKARAAAALAASAASAASAADGDRAQPQHAAKSRSDADLDHEHQPFVLLTEVRSDWTTMASVD
eukprot:jgi/Hompol1/4595/HPOL_001793-RA